MDWKPNNLTREAVGEFLESMVSVLPGVMGIDEVIAGCRVVNLDPYGVGLATYPRYIQVALRDRYYQDIMYRGGLSGLAVGDYVTVVHMRDGNRYELMTAGGSAGVVVNPAPAEADYVVTAGDPLLTNAHVAQAGQWTAITAAAGTFQTDFHPDKPVVVTGAGVVTEYASIQAAITAAVDCDTVLVPPGDYTEDITLKNGVCVKGFGPRAKIRILGDEDVVTTADGGWLENVTIVATDPVAGAFAGVKVSHSGTCRMRNITIEVSQTTDNRACGIAASGASDGLLIIDEVDISVSSSGNVTVYGAYFLAGFYGLEMKNFKIEVVNTNVAVGAHARGIRQLGTASIKATEGWIDTSVNGGTAQDLVGTITYSEIVDTSDDTLFGQNVWLLDGNAIGIDGNERLIFNAAGNATFAGVTSVVVPNGCWVGADAGCSWLFDSAAGDVTTFDKVGLGTLVPGWPLTVNATFTAIAGTSYGVYAHIYDNPPGASLASTMGAVFRADRAAANAQNGGYIYGVLSQADHSGSGTGVILYGYQGTTRLSTVATGAVSIAYGLYTRHFNAVGVTTTMYGLFLASPSIPSGSVTNPWGVYQQYATAKNYFAGNVGIATVAPSRIFDCNDGSGNMIADGYDTHPSWLSLKVDPQPLGDVLTKFKQVKPYEYKRIPYVSADELAQAAIAKFGQERWDELFPDDHRDGKVKDIPDPKIQRFIDKLAAQLRAERGELPQWRRRHYGLVIDDLLDTFPDIISRNDEGEIDGYSLNSYVGLLHACITELIDRMEQLEARWLHKRSLRP